MGLIDTIISSVKREISESALRPTHYAIMHATYKKRKSEIPGAPGFDELSEKKPKTIEFKVPFKAIENNQEIPTNKAKAFIQSHPDHNTLKNAGFYLSSVEHKKNIAIKQHKEEVEAVVAEIEQHTNIVEFPVKENIKVVKMESSRPVGVVLSFIKKEEQVSEALGTMANIKKASRDAAARSADPRTKPGDAPAWLTKAIKDRAAKKVQKEEVELEEAVTVKKSTHSWGKMVTVHHGSSHSFPLHPEHQEAIAKLKDGESTSFTDETKSKVTAHREGDTVHLSHRGSNTKTPVAMSHFMEEVELDEGMPSGVIKDKQRLSQMTDQEFAQKYKDSTPESLRAKARTHAIKDPDHYIKRREAGLKEELELDEAKRGRPRKDGSKPSGDEEGGREHIIVQLRKAENLRGERHTEFNDTSKHKLPLEHVKKALDMHSKMKPIQKGEFEARLAKSHKSFHDAISGKPAEPAKPRVTLAKSVREDADPITRASDRGAISTYVRIGPDGRPMLVKKTAARDEIKVEAVDKFAKQYTDTDEAEEEKREGQSAPKGASVDMTADSAKKYQKDALVSKEKIKLPPTRGNVAAGGEDTVYGGGKYSVAEEKKLNTLYSKLDEDNKVLFNELIQTNEGTEELIKFAVEQGI